MHSCHLPAVVARRTRARARNPLPPAKSAAAVSSYFFPFSTRRFFSRFSFSRRPLRRRRSAVRFYPLRRRQSHTPAGAGQSRPPVTRHLPSRSVSRFSYPPPLPSCRVDPPVRWRKRVTHTHTRAPRPCDTTSVCPENGLAVRIERNDVSVYTENNVQYVRPRPWKLRRRSSEIKNCLAQATATGQHFRGGGRPDA